MTVTVKPLSRTLTTWSPGTGSETDPQMEWDSSVYESMPASITNPALDPGTQAMGVFSAYCSCIDLDYKCDVETPDYSETMLVMVAIPEGGTMDDAVFVLGCFVTADWTHIQQALTPGVWTFLFGVQRGASAGTIQGWIDNVELTPTLRLSGYPVGPYVVQAPEGSLTLTPQDPSWMSGYPIPAGALTLTGHAPDFGAPAIPIPEGELILTARNPSYIWSLPAAAYPAAQTIFTCALTASGAEEEEEVEGVDFDDCEKGADVAPHNMTAADEPAPYYACETLGSQTVANEPAWKCFDGDDATFFESDGEAGYIDTSFGDGNGKTIYGIAIKARADDASNAPSYIKVITQPYPQTLIEVSGLTWTAGETKYFDRTHNLDWMNLETEDLIFVVQNAGGEVCQVAEIYIYEVLDAADGIDAIPNDGTDLDMPMSSFQARLRDGEPSYLSCVIPNASDYEAGIAARPNGQIVVKQGYRLIDGSVHLEEIIRVDFETLAIAEGGRNSSATIVGHKTVSSTAPKDREVGALTYYALQTDNKRRFRTEVDPFLRPGDTAVFVRNGVEDSFIVGEIVYVVNTSQAYMEVAEA